MDWNYFTVIWGFGWIISFIALIVLVNWYSNRQTKTMLIKIGVNVAADLFCIWLASAFVILPIYFFGYSWPVLIISALFLCGLIAFIIWMPESSSENGKPSRFASKDAAIVGNIFASALILKLLWPLLLFGLLKNRQEGKRRF